MKFMVTGHGRSGTMFLARTLNLSPTWSVDHEALAPSGPASSVAHRDLITPDMVKAWFNSKSGNYGMVNGYMRTHGHHAPVDIKAIILRCPFEVALSVHNRGNWENFLKCCEHDYRRLDWMAKLSDFVTFKFHDMFKMDTFQEIAAKLGVTDCPVTQGILDRKVNQGRGSWKKLPVDRIAAVKKLSWFKDEWNL